MIAYLVEIFVFLVKLAVRLIVIGCIGFVVGFAWYYFSTLVLPAF